MKATIQTTINSNEHPFTKRLDGAFKEAVEGLNETFNKQTQEIIEDNLTRFSDLVQTMNTLLDDIHKDMRESMATNDRHGIGRFAGTVEMFGNLSRQIQENQTTLIEVLAVATRKSEESLSTLETGINGEIENSRNASLKQFEVLSYLNNKSNGEIAALLADFKVPRRSDPVLTKWQQLKRWATTFEAGK